MDDRDNESQITKLNKPEILHDKAIKKANEITEYFKPLSERNQHERDNSYATQCAIIYTKGIISELHLNEDITLWQSYRINLWRAVLNILKNK